MYRDTLGLRMHSARKDAGFTSVARFVSEINTILEINGSETITEKAYRNWEKQGTRGYRKTRTQPPPLFYVVFTSLTGVTGYWLFYGDKSGVIRRIEDLPARNREFIDEQLEALNCPRRRDLVKEFLRVVATAKEDQRRTLVAFLKTI